MTPDAANDLDALQAALGHRFADPALLAQARPDATLGGRGDRGAPAVNERLEFLGDRVLGLIVAEWLMERFPDEAEGDLARRHTALVRAETLSAVGEVLVLTPLIRMAVGEGDRMRDGGPVTASVLADAVEALIGAIYLDGGLPPARAFIRARWADAMQGAAAPPQDPKTALQEWTLGRGIGLPHYELVERSGPDHAPLFRVRVTIKGYDPVMAEGASKRAAEKEAATRLLAGLPKGKKE